MKNQILNKILNDDGSLVWKYSKTACVQKYFTKDEIEFLNNCFGKTFSEKYYCLKNDINCAPKCNCGKPLKFISFKIGYQKYCSNSCTCKNREYKEEWKEKRAKTNLEKYGNANTFSLVDNNKRKTALIEKFGGESPFCSKEIREKALNNRTGDYNTTSQAQQLRLKKQSETLSKKYNMEITNPKQTPKARESAKKQLESQNYNIYRKRGYVFENIRFDSSWELAYFIYMRDNNYNIKRNKEKFFKYFDNKNISHKYFPDFIVDGNYVEIKSSYIMDGEDWTYKKAIIEVNNITLISDDEIKKYFKYVYNKYGKNYLKQFKVKTDKDFKRQIIEVKQLSEVDDLYEKRNSNVKIKYFCQNCGKVKYLSIKEFLHFKDLKCKKCREIV